MCYSIRTIVAGVATLDEHDPVLRPALDLAERMGAVLHLVHAFELPDPAWDAYARMGFMSGEALREYTEGIRAQLERRVRDLAPRCELRCHALAGPAAPVLQVIAYQEAADLVVVGATRRGALARAILGTTAQRVVREASAPVLVLREPWPARLGRVLLTTDLSSLSAGVHEIGLDLVESLGGGDGLALRSLLVVAYAVSPPPPLAASAFEETAREELGDFLAQRRERQRRVEGAVRVGDPTRQIVAEAAEWGADLMVLGTHGRVGPRRFLLGSVAEATVRDAGCNVLVIPAVLAEQVRPAGSALSAAAGS